MPITLEQASDIIRKARLFRNQCECGGTYQVEYFDDNFTQGGEAISRTSKVKACDSCGYELEDSDNI